jgi:acyl-CoA dehydrogenase
MADFSYLDWPFFEPHHRERAQALEAWCSDNLQSIGHDDVDAICRQLVQMLGNDDWLLCTAPDSNDTDPQIDVRSLCLMREILARHHGLADFCFAMQGLGTMAITLFGTPQQKGAWLDRTRRGDAISAFALTEPASGSDVANMTLSAERTTDGYVLNGEKTWISNGGIADVYTVFARTGEASGAGGISAFVVDATAPGLKIAERLHTIAPHPLARLHFDNCEIPADALLGESGRGFRVAMASLDVMRSTVGAAALGLRGVPSMKACTALTSESYSALHWPNCKWCKGIWPIWRWISMLQHC